jgi:hypothetical protein
MLPVPQTISDWHWQTPLTPAQRFASDNPNHNLDSNLIATDRGLDDSRDHAA